MEAALEDLLPQTVNAYGFRRGSTTALAIMPLRLLVERFREMGLPLAIQHIDVGEVSTEFSSVRPGLP